MVVASEVPTAKNKLRSLFIEGAIFKAKMRGSKIMGSFEKIQDVVESSPP